ncbi:MAG: hypothetical protein CMM46_03920 [Rhodospirillaceae bacterium]|nr:hypothetical protein [Rhodospirillaceae bacterium]MBN33916.1 hypothetical protein [Rhodospirillaceae bacterium]|tara:strand:+ start:114 stop:533 length:420 start_codon:yes stop_codon:yes gene_type:complete
MTVTPTFWSRAVMLSGGLSLVAYMMVWPYSIQSLTFAFPLALPFVGAILSLKLGLLLLRVGWPMLPVFIVAALIVGLLLGLGVGLFLHVIGALADNEASFGRDSLMGTLFLLVPWSQWAAWPAGVGLWLILRHDPGLER